jgi:hypothetical protein
MSDPHTAVTANRQPAFAALERLGLACHPLRPGVARQRRWPAELQAPQRGIGEPGRDAGEARVKTAQDFPLR